jgi:hypothetical protein
MVKKLIEGIGVSSAKIAKNIVMRLTFILCTTNKPNKISGKDISFLETGIPGFALADENLLAKCYC